MIGIFLSYIVAYISYISSQKKREILWQVPYQGSNLLQILMRALQGWISYTKVIQSADKFF